MINKIRHTLSLIILLAFSSVMFAQQMPGKWTIYPVIGRQYDKIIDSKDYVYFLSSSSLYSYNKSEDETYFYDSSNKLSGSNIKDMYYNHEGSYLVIVYADSNMDMLFDDGSCYALPEIKDANLTDDKTINDIAFGAGRIFVATNFGLVVFDEEKKEVIESGIYRSPIESVTVSGDYLVIYNPYNMMVSPVKDRHNSLQKFTAVGGTYTDNMMALDDNIIIFKDLNNNILKISTVDFENGTRETVITDYKIDGDISQWRDGFYIRSGNTVNIFNRKAQKIDSFTLPSNLSACNYAFYEGKESVWLGGENGSAHYDMSTSDPTILSDWYRPESVTCKEVVLMRSTYDGKRIYISNYGPTNYRDYITFLPNGDNTNMRQYTNAIEDGVISDVSIINASVRTSSALNNQRVNNNKAMYGGPTSIAPHPTQPNVYAIGNGQEGVFIVEGNEEVAHFDVTNAPFKSYWNTRAFDVNYDPQGNLWVGLGHFENNLSPYIMLPASKMKNGYDNVKDEDWQWVSIPGLSAGTKDFLSVFARKSNFAFFSTYNSHGIFVIDTKGTYDDLSDDVSRYYSSMIDQDGNTISPEMVYSIDEDRDGRIWIGTNQGLFYIPNTSAIGQTLSVIRPKVPRNDGTNYADLLLSTDIINYISTDPSNRKWVATDFSGLYLVSANGDKILKHFDTSNSPLFSNRVLSVCADPMSNTVYIGTLNGLLSYQSDSSPAMDDFSEVYAYPNPVKPDYTGWITIAGLMDNSLVKIADSAGNVLFQSRSEGGMISWDGCNNSGERVRSGVYFVYASTGGDGVDANAVVTKIMIIR